MATVLETNARNAALAAVCALCNGGKIEFQTSGSVKVAEITLAATAFGAPANGVATLAATTPDTNAVGGTIAKAVFKTSGGVAVMTVDVLTAAGADRIVMSSLVIAAGDTVSLTSYTHTQPA